MTSTYALFKPFLIGSMELANRIFLAGMPRNPAIESTLGAARAYFRRRA